MAGDGRTGMATVETMPDGILLRPAVTLPVEVCEAERTIILYDLTNT